LSVGVSAGRGRVELYARLTGMQLYRMLTAAEVGFAAVDVL